MFDWQDHVVIGVYFFFMLVIGVVFRATSKDSSDFFRGGGEMSWWMTGATAFMANFSAWTFVACGGRIYSTGTLIVLTTFLLQGVIGVVMALTWVVWFRRMRVVTPVDAIRRRFGPVTEQLYAWQSVIVQFLFAGVGLFTLAVFISPLLGIGMTSCILLVGGVIVFLSATGGAWAVVASDFIQMLVIVIIVLLTSVLVLLHPDIGGPTGLVAKVPSYTFDWTEFTRLPVMILFIVGSFMMCLLFMFNMSQGAGRFLYVRSDRDAKLAALVFAIGFVVGPLIWFIPVLGGTVLVPDLAADPRFATLKTPEEAAYLATAALVLPKGMLGMLACGIFAATMSMMDSGLNRNSGILVCNIYRPLIRPDASEKELLIAGKLFTVVIGVLMIGGGIAYSGLADFNLFAWTQHINAALIVPLTIPLALGLLFRRTSDGTAVFSIFALAGMGLVLKFAPIPWQGLSTALGWGELTDLEMLDFTTAIIVLAECAVGLAIFGFGALRYRQRGADETLGPGRQEELEGFITDLETPLVSSRQENRRTDRQQFGVLGGLSLGYGLVILACVFLPNDGLGRLCFLLCGGAITIVGAVMLFFRRENAGDRADAKAEADLLTRADADAPGGA